MAASFYQTPLYVFFPALSPSFFLWFLSCLPTFRVPPLKSKIRTPLMNNDIMLPDMCIMCPCFLAEIYQKCFAGSVGLSESQLGHLPIWCWLLVTDVK